MQEALLLERHPERRHPVVPVGLSRRPVGCQREVEDVLSGHGRPTPRGAAPPRRWSCRRRARWRKVADSSIQSMLWTLDPHSSFFTRDEFRKLYEEQASQFYGIGVSILQHRDGVYVQSVIPNTPADKAGLRYGDRFLQVDGKDATEWSSVEVSKNVRGKGGTPVKVKVERVSSAAPLDFEIVRGGVPLPSIRNYFMLPNGVGYVGLTGGFQETTSEELSQAINDLQRQGMKSLVLDLRNNPGGLLPQAIDVVGKFVPSGQTVVSVKGRAAYAKDAGASFKGRSG